MEARADGHRRLIGPKWIAESPCMFAFAQSVKFNYPLSVVEYLYIIVDRLVVHSSTESKIADTAYCDPFVSDLP